MATTNAGLGRLILGAFISSLPFRAPAGMVGACHQEGCEPALKKRSRVNGPRDRGGPFGSRESV
jgi:hypothetical protein